MGVAAQQALMVGAGGRVLDEGIDVSPSYQLDFFSPAIDRNNQLLRVANSTQSGPDNSGDAAL